MDIFLQSYYIISFTCKKSRSSLRPIVQRFRSVYLPKIPAITLGLCRTPSRRICCSICWSLTTRSTRKTWGPSTWSKGLYWKQLISGKYTPKLWRPLAPTRSNISSKSLWRTITNLITMPNQPSFTQLPMMERLGKNNLCPKRSNLSNPSESGPLKNWLKIKIHSAAWAKKQFCPCQRTG